MQREIRFLILALCISFIFGVTTGHIATRQVSFDGATIIAPIDCQATPSSCVDAKTLAKDLLTPQQYRCLNLLLTKESHWRAAALNKRSGSTGIGQLLPETWRNIGMTPTNDGISQLVATLAYISRHYGTGGPCAAWEKWQKHKHY